MRLRTVRTTALLALAAAVLAAPAASAGKRTSSSVLTASGGLLTYVNDFVATIPGRDSGGYDVPTAAQVATFTGAVDKVLAGDLNGAASTLEPLKYTVVRFTDTVTGRTAVLLRERKVDGRYLHGWGLYAFGPAGSSVVVEVAHPVADANTEDVGVQAFREADAAALLVAGAHRYANGDGADAEADVAHRTDSVFDAVHRRLVHADLRVLQPHGFGEATHELVGHEVVVSNGGAPTVTTGSAWSALSAAGFVSCLYDGAQQCWQLGATRNVQGAQTRTAGGEFVHVESYTPIRTDSTRRDLLATTVAGVLQ